jgi:nicotinic acid mononucleotide adenylyltransferase
MIRHCRRWLQAWLLPSERPWQQALAENRARMVALEERMAELELILKNEERAASLAQWELPDMDAHLGAN